MKTEITAEHEVGEMIEITLGSINTTELKALTEFVNEFDLEVRIVAITTPVEDRQMLRLPPDGGVAIQLTQNKY